MTADIKTACYPAKVQYNFQNACVYRALVISISADHATATVQWSGPTMPELSTATNDVDIDSACVGCLLPSGVIPPAMWLCVGDKVLVLDSMNDEDPARWLIIGLDRRYHASPVPAACFMLTGFPIAGATYDAPWFTEAPEVIDGVPTGYTLCSPMNPDLSGDPRGTEAYTGIILPVVAGGQVVAVKEYMLPSFSALIDAMNTSWPVRVFNGYAYRLGFTEDYDASRVGDDLSVSLTASYQAAMICPRSLEMKSPIYDESPVFSFTITGYYDMLALRWDAVVGFYGDGSCGDWGGFYLDNGGDLHYQFILHRIAISPDWNANGDLDAVTNTSQAVAVAATSATTTRSRTQDHTATGVPDPQEWGVHYDRTTTIIQSQDETNFFSGTMTVRSYPEFDFTMLSSYSTSYEFESDQIYLDDFVGVEGTVTPKERDVVIDRSFTGTAKAEYFFGLNKIGEFSTQVTSSKDKTETFRYLEVPDTTETFYSDRTITSKGCYAVWSCSKAVLILSWDCGVISAQSTEDNDNVNTELVPISIDFSLKLFEIDGNSITLEQWTFSPSEPYQIYFNVNTVDPGNLGEADAFPGFPSQTDLSWSDSSNKEYAQIGVPYEFPQWGRVFSLYTYFTDQLSQEVRRHLGDKFSLVANFSVFFDGRIDRITGLPMVGMLNLAVGGNIQPAGQVLLAQDQEQLRVKYNFDGVAKERLFYNGSEVDIEALRGA